jgi:transcription-repair coupling factor (superfamily II helicase)
MKETELEKVVLEFYRKELDVFVTTTIIESGIDVPNANTLIINRADQFGLAQLYQLRGRVGRGQQRAYAYLMVPEDRQLTPDAQKRLDVIQKFVELGSGFNIASHDLEIRGGGDLLGASQSGHIAAVGFDLYAELLDEAIQELKGKKRETKKHLKDPEIKVPFSALLAESYISDTQTRLSLYRRLSGSEDETELEQIETELEDRFGPLPLETQNLLWLIRLKITLKKLGIRALTQGPERIVLTPGSETLLDPIRAISLVSSQPKKYSLSPDSKFIFNAKILTIKELYFEVQNLLNLLTSSK